MKMHNPAGAPSIAKSVADACLARTQRWMVRGVLGSRFKLAASDCKMQRRTAWQTPASSQ